MRRFFPLCTLLISLIFLLPAIPLSASTVSIFRPYDKMVTYKEKLAIVGKAFGASDLKINGFGTEMSVSGSFKGELILTPGKNLVMVEASFGKNRQTFKKRILRKISFSDIKGSKHWAKSKIEDLATLGYIEGYPDGLFNPNQPITKGELATWLARIEKNPKKKLPEDVSLDVPLEHWRAKDVLFCLEKGYLTMESEAIFGIDSFISRAKMAEVINRFLKLALTIKESSSFMDVKKDTPYRDAIETAFQSQLIQGVSYKNRWYAPTRDITRAEVVALLSRMKKIKEENLKLKSFRTGYDLSRLTRIEIAPKINLLKVTPLKIPLNGKVPLTITASVEDAGGLMNITAVKADLTSLNGPADALLSDNGLQGDKVKNDGTYTLQLLPKAEVSLGQKKIMVTVINQTGWKKEAEVNFEIISPNVTPQILSAVAVPMFAREGQKVSLAVKVIDENGAQDIESVGVDLSVLGVNKKILLSDDGQGPDLKAHDQIYMTEITIPKNTTKGEKDLPVKALDKAGAFHESVIKLIVK